jgi:hypothetical protein
VRSKPPTETLSQEKVTTSDMIAPGATESVPTVNLSPKHAPTNALYQPQKTLTAMTTQFISTRGYPIELALLEPSVYTNPKDPFVLNDPSPINRADADAQDKANPSLVELKSWNPVPQLPQISLRFSHAKDNSRTLDTITKTQDSQKHKIQYSKPSTHSSPPGIHKRTRNPFGRV